MAKRLLVVDDEECIRTVYGRYLAKKGFEIIYASNGTEGLEKYFSEKPDIVLTDMHMPDKDGIWLYSKIKEFNPGAKIFIMSDDGMRIQPLLERGFNRFIKKDGHLKSLDRIIEEK